MLGANGFKSVAFGNLENDLLEYACTLVAMYDIDVLPDEDLPDYWVCVP